MASFRAYVVEHADGAATRGFRELTEADLPEGDVTVRVEWSDVNYKDALAVCPTGRVARISPLVPGIDLAGTAVETGERVLAHGYDLGVSHHGGYAELARVPAGWIVPLPDGLSAREAMAIGTAGYTAALSVLALEEHGIAPGDGPVLVLGATGGVGSVAAQLLAQRGYEVAAATGKPERADLLRELGAGEILTREETTAEGRPLERERWAACVDPVGGAATAYALRTTRAGGAVALSGNVGGAELETTVFPFILRGVSLLGIDSANTPIERRREVWRALAGELRPANLDALVHEIGFDELDGTLDATLRGEGVGRTIVRVGAG